MAAKFNPNDTMASLAKVVRGTRKAAALTQLELAELAEVGKSAVFDIEKGKANVQFSTLLKVLRVLHIELNFKPPVTIGADRKGGA
jgi:y4mF family transcriptional regulator